MTWPRSSISLAPSLCSLVSTATIQALSPPASWRCVAHEFALCALASSQALLPISFLADSGAKTSPTGHSHAHAQQDMVISMATGPLPYVNSTLFCDPTNWRSVSLLNNCPTRAFHQMSQGFIGRVTFTITLNSTCHLLASCV